MASLARPHRLEPSVRLQSNLTCLGVRMDHPLDVKGAMSATTPVVVERLAERHRIVEVYGEPRLRRPPRAGRLPFSDPEALR